MVMTEVSPKTITSFQQFILSLYKEHKRDLPWRKTNDPYCILVSEIMSQQTQIARVVPKYLSWIKKFPTIVSLAHAQTRDVLAYWSGLGYNRRAVYLQRCAQKILTTHQGVFPQEENELLKLPGVGDYTAKAILCFAFNNQVAVIDTNIRKVITVHFYDGSVPEKKELESFAEKLIPKNRAYDWNQALMDYAGQELKRKKIPVVKQAPFKNSNRYFRGQILKYLLRQRTISQNEFFDIFHQNIEQKRLKKILLLLAKDKLIVGKKGTYSLP